MNPAIHAALVASHQQVSLEDKLKKAGATSVSTAIEFTPANDMEQKQLDDAIAREVVSRGTNGRIHLNEMALANQREGQGMMALLMLLIAASIIASGAALVLVG